MKTQNAHLGSEEYPYDAIVIGAGVVGCAAATTFARQGRSVLLLERSLREPNRIVGELLQPGGVNALERLGMSDCLEGIDAFPVKGYEVLYRGENIVFWYPLVESQQTLIQKRAASARSEEHTRPEGRSFHHGKFITKLRETARQEQNVRVLEATVKELLKCERSGVVGRAYGVIGHGPPILLYQIGKHETRILIDIPTDVYKTLSSIAGVKSHIKKNVIPILPESVRPMVEIALQEGRLRSMANSWLPASVNNTPGAILLGDAMNMRHPLVGGGMTVGLNDVVLLSELLDPLIVPYFHDTKVVMAQMKCLHSGRKKVNMTLNVLAQALYSLFVADDPQLQILQRGFVRYIQLGGSRIEEPAGLLGGVIHSPWLLFYHFFAVALYSLGIYIRESCAISFWNLGPALVDHALKPALTRLDDPAAIQNMPALNIFRSKDVSYNSQPSFRRELGYVSQPNQRGTIDIMWECSLVLFVSVWVVMHHNVPIKGESLREGITRKIRWVALAVCAPEMLTLFAVMQWNAANISVKEMQKIGGRDWSIVHAFYANSGGFILHTKDCPAINPLELLTIAFILPTISTVFFWANKPQNAAETTIIRPGWLIADVLIAAGDAAKEPYGDTPMDFVKKPPWEGWKRRPSLLHFGGLECRPLARIPNDYSPPPPTKKEALFIWLVSIVHAGVHLIGWNFEFPTPTEALI
ncbi:hypothetical protein G7Y89_g59 [Cudoniella acicularis]|uniref:squalene monooxygenase n=1 Tax=Cudoniella acicularis TaxID=354080 RepID=A0A8H4RZF8_9HELO|nr:hypothetical protein G7Y89_g59 [Cudoniella acicularis]